MTRAQWRASLAEAQGFQEQAFQAVMRAVERNLAQWQKPWSYDKTVDMEERIGVFTDVGAALGVWRAHAKHHEDLQRRYLHSKDRRVK